MPVLILKGLLGSLLGDALRLVGGVTAGLLICLLIAIHLLPALLLTAALPGGPTSPIDAPAPPADLAAVFAEVEDRTGIPASLLTAIAFVESGFNPRAVGPRIERFAGTEDEHALGLMQFLPSTYHALAPRVDALIGIRLGEIGVWSPRHAVYAAAFYLKDSGAPADPRRALYTYNQDWTYGDRVLALAARYAQPPASDDVAARALAIARTQLGKPYFWGGADERGFDCSGLTRWAYAAAGVSLPRTAEQQYRATQRVRREDLRPGDLVFFCCDPEQPGVAISHVSLYVGDGWMLDAPAPGAVVRIEPLWSGYVSGGRVVPLR